LELRFQVSKRAAGRCEYCLIHEHDAAFGHEVDHVISRQHGGLSESDNLAFACLFCNRIKGTNLASINPAGGALVPCSIRAGISATIISGWKVP
jgi:5-methylcytosine-specific restriction endonuclease McrA